MKHKLSKEDIRYFNAFQRCEIAVDEFNHKAHLKLAYILLVHYDVEEAYVKLKSYLLNFLKYNGVPENKFHETMTRAWLLAVKHFMHVSSVSENAEDFISNNDILSDKEIMFTHYSRDLMSTELARTSFIAPDLEPIPVYKV